MEYADVLWDGCTESESESESDYLEHAQYKAVELVTGAMKGTSKHRLMEEVGWESMSTRRKIHKHTLYYKIVNNCSPSYLSDLLPFQVCQRTQHKLRNCIDYSLFACRTERFRKSFFLPRQYCGTI